MRTKLWKRREVLGHGARLVVGAAIGGWSYRTAQATQLPAPVPQTDERLTFVVTTEAKAWQPGALFKPTFQWDLLNLNVELEQAAATDTTVGGMEGFGACFNELGWTSLSLLSAEDRESVMKELFDPVAGARFTYCRMPIGANDFATEAYSYDEVDGDFALKHFSIEHDRKTLVPFIHAAQKYQPKLRLWASPWTPPSWMKRNKFYAEAKAYPGMKENGILPEQIGHEGEDMFIQEAKYFETYAKYFGKFIEAYRAEKIPVGMVMPQNEFNSAQNFPSCTWTPEGLAAFLRYLGPEMTKRDVQIFFGTLERGNPKLLETVLADKEAARFIKGVGMQWAGKNGVPAMHRKYPEMPIFQSEQECGDGANSWSYTSYCWHLMKEYFRNGARGYMYWNISTENGGKSTWGWGQNSLVSVDPVARTFTYNHDYYLLKHLTHFVDVGAKHLELTGTCDDAIGFRNPDGTMVMIVRNELAHRRLVQVQAGARVFAMELPGDAVGTVAIRA